MLAFVPVVQGDLAECTATGLGRAESNVSFGVCVPVLSPSGVEFYGCLGISTGISISRIRIRNFDFSLFPKFTRNASVIYWAHEPVLCYYHLLYC